MGVDRTEGRRRKGRGKSVERFAMLPEGVLESMSYQALTHAARSYLTLMVKGRVPQHNGTLMMTESYAKENGFSSKDTLHRSLEALREHKLIEVTRLVSRKARHATLYAVTWLPIYNRDGQPLDTPEQPSHAYLSWKPAAKPERIEPRIWYADELGFVRLRRAA